MATIRRLTTTVVDVPLPRPLTTAIHTIRSAGCVLVDVERSDGAVGQGYVFTIDGRRIRAFDEVLRDFGDLVTGRDADDPAALWRLVWDDCNPTGHAGITVSCLAAVDMAVWDARARALDRSLHDLFGTVRDRIPTYASSGLWLSSGLDDLQAEAARFVEQGFRAVKVRVGSPEVADDVTRVAAVRDAVGPDVAVHADANQAFQTEHAVRLAEALTPMDLAWLEEPVAYDDLDGHAAVRTTGLPVATGETVFAARGIAAILDAGAADVVMPDLQRVGGFTEMRRACALAGTAGVPVSTHFFTEHSLTVAASTPGCVSVEHVDWFTPLFAEDLELVEGQLVVPDRPGTGFTFDEDARKRFG